MDLILSCVTSYVVSAFRRTVTVRLKPDTTNESEMADECEMATRVAQP
jgi:hypothetical protein